MTPTVTVTPTPTPTSSPSPSSLINNLPDLNDIPDPGSLVTFVQESWVPALGTLLAIVLIVAAALALRKLTHRLITRVTGRMAEGVMPDRLRNKSPTVTESSPALLSERRRQRAETMGSVLRSLTSIVIIGTAALMVIDRLGMNLAPLLTSVSILGVALGFGAQELIKDFFAGMFMLLEDQYGVGDVIDLGSATGTVEAVTLRVTRLRDPDGRVWYVRNGTVTRVGNESQGWARAVMDVPVDNHADAAKVKQVLMQAAKELWEDPAYHQTVIFEEPQVWGFEGLSETAIVFRITVKTDPLQRAALTRKLRRRVKAALDSADIAIVAESSAP
ncbi:mechanosensitive ion channel family protein [Sinosporangium album]|uniref:mechanosensitive ion channel family protein n=1 Tax=Sinosporangium album TaxID=504805 RepID=UPI001FDF31AA|nr:mechanosensitive ion channel family protein [Sinosporangium album]